MNRRAFISTGLVVPVAIAAALSAACKAPAPRQTTVSPANPAPQTEPAVAPIVGPGPGGATFMLQHPLPLLDELVQRTSSQVTSDDFEAWGPRTASSRRRPGAPAARRCSRRPTC